MTVGRTCATTRATAAIVSAPSPMWLSSSSPRYRSAPMISAARRDSSAPAPPAWPPPRAPWLSVRIATASPSRLWTSSVPPAPISTSSGCAPTASTLSRAAFRFARPLFTSVVAVAIRSSGWTGFSRNSSASLRMAWTA